MVININNPEDVTNLAKQTRWLNRPIASKVTIDLNLYSPENSRKSERKIHKLLNDCGCHWGEIILLIVFLSTFLPRLMSTGFSWKLFLICFGISFAIALPGKFLGLYVSYRKLHKLYKEIILSISEFNQT